MNRRIGKRRGLNQDAKSDPKVDSKDRSKVKPFENSVIKFLNKTSALYHRHK